MNRVVYEAYGPGGCAIIIDGLTDNRNRTSQEIKHLLSKNGGVLASPGSASWAFEKTLEGWLPQTHVSLSEEDNGSLWSSLKNLKKTMMCRGFTQMQSDKWCRCILFPHSGNRCIL